MDICRITQKVNLFRITFDLPIPEVAKALTIFHPCLKLLGQIFRSLLFLVFCVFACFGLVWFILALAFASKFRVLLHFFSLRITLTFFFFLENFIKNCTVGKKYTGAQMHFSCPFMLY